MNVATISSREMNKLNLVRGVPTDSYLRTELDEELLAYRRIFKNNDNNSDSAFQEMNEKLANGSLNFKNIKTNLTSFIGKTHWLNKFI